MKQKVYLGIQISLIIISLLVIVVSHFFYEFKPISLIGDAASACGIIYTFFSMKNKKIYFIFGILNNVFYGISAFLSNVYAISVYALAFCIPILIIGLINYDKKQKKGTMKIKRFKGKQNLFYLLLIPMYVVFFFILKALNGNMYYLDAFVTANLMLSLILLTNQFIESYIFFNIGNIGSIVMYSILLKDSLENIPILVMWCIYLTFGVMGLFSWLNMYKKQNIEQVPLTDNTNV